jgi:geranylgeranyl pyrophosphate synthase
MVFANDLEFLKKIKELLTQSNDFESVLGGIDHLYNPSSLLANLPSLCCQAAGGEMKSVEPITLAWRYLYIASYLLDKIQDDNQVLRVLEPGVAVNFATSILFLANQTLWRRGEIDITALDEIRRMLFDKALDMCKGQHLALTQKQFSIEECWRLAGLRSGSFFAAGCQAGAMLGSCNKQCLANIDKFGRLLGIILQAHDDLSEISPDEDNLNDFVKDNRRSLAIAYALNVLPPHPKNHLLNCLQSSSTDAAHEAKKIVIESGAFIYLGIKVKQFSKQAKDSLRSAFTESDALLKLLGILQDLSVLHIG